MTDFRLLSNLKIHAMIMGWVFFVFMKKAMLVNVVIIRVWKWQSSLLNEKQKSRLCR